ncbi:MAG TPA: alkaline phosphatase D family protein [Gemmatimonadaceae bacterium]|nr:alkaline phosphatase D family protein [Gemmatimonadaceae bacterium]
MMNRRVFVGDLTRIAALAAVVPNDWRVKRRVPFADDPFQLGVASGDPGPDGVVLWTRLSPRPLEADGGMTAGRVAVRWEVAEDEAFSRIVKRGTATATPELSWSVHVDVGGLRPDRWYFYRFMSGDATSETGRTRTTPARDAATPLRFAFVSCQHYEQGLYTAYRHLATEGVDLVAHLGDYIYETPPAAGRVRAHTGPLLMQLDDYRRRYAQYKADPYLRAAHAAAPWVVTWDDHEVSNNYAGLIAADTTLTTDVMRARRAAAYRAWWEHQPVRLPASGDWSNLSITRRMDWGTVARFSVLDTRQFRSDQACGDGSRVVPCGEWADPSRTMMGERQEKWLYDGLSSRASWQVLANQVMVAPFDSLAGDGERVSMDQWSGYPVARDRLLGEIAKRAPNRTVVLTGDIHSSWVNELRSSFSAADTPVVAAEFVGTSISSGGDGSDRNVVERVTEDNRHVMWQNGRRGYATCTVTAAEWRTEYRTLGFVTKPDSPVTTATKWILRNGAPGVTRDSG